MKKLLLLTLALVLISSCIPIEPEDECNVLKGQTTIDNCYFEKAISIYRQGSVWPSWVNYFKILLTLAKVMNNEKDVNLHDIFKCHNDNKFKLLRGWMQNCIGKILLNIDDQHIPEAEDWIKKAIEADERNDTKWDLGQDYALYAEFFKLKGDQSKAKENLTKAIEIFKECGADGWVDRYEKELILLA